MNCLGCNLIETAPVTLRTGTVVCSSCEAWRHECEARDTMLRSRPEIEHYFDLVEKARGLDARQALRNEMIALHKAKTVL
jgi:transcription elongation factor Elf1